MKCVKKDKKISRVSDERAFKLVQDSGYAYCPKSEYKDSRKPKSSKKD